jgi:hypothetical protein
MKYLFVILLLVISFVSAGLAQETKVTAEIIAASSTKIVKDAPFSAEAISESVQVLADGNKITRSNTVRMYRDREGRFRREGAGSTGGGYTAYGGNVVSVYGFQDGISIFDPVEGVRYILNPRSKTARRFSVKNTNYEGAVIVGGQPMNEALRKAIELKTTAVQKATTQDGGKANVVVLGNVATTSGAGKTESLGVRTIEGVEAEGTRTTTTIAAGAIGNEKPIEIVYERWYSKELELIVYSRHSDPRFGEQTYRLANISRNEPERSLFTPPSDYKILSEPPVTTTIQRKPQ